MLVNVARPCSMAATIVAKSSSSSTRSAASRATSVPLRPMAMPMSAAWQRGPVVDAVAGHRDDVATRLERTGDAELVLGRDPGDHDAVVVEQCAAAPARRRAGRRRSSTGLPALRQPDLPRDRRRRRRMVAGDHRDADAGATARGDRGRGLVRGGSSSPTSPSNVEVPLDARRRCAPRVGPPGRSRLATARTRRPRRSAASSAACASAGVAAQRGSTASGAPLTSSWSPATTDIRRRRGSNGKPTPHVRTRGSVAATSAPSRRASASSAASIGSPCATQTPSLLDGGAGRAAVAADARRACAPRRSASGLAVDRAVGVVALARDAAPPVGRPHLDDASSRCGSGFRSCRCR